MADLQPLRALRYDLDRVGGLAAVTSPPYDVIDAEQRAALVSRSPYNAVVIDLPEGEDPYVAAAQRLAAWMAEGVVARDAEPALYTLEQDFTGPDGVRRTRRGILGRVRVEPYGAGRVRAHERTHPGPKEDRLRLTRATRANLSPIFALHDDPQGRAWQAMQGAIALGETTDEDGTVHRLGRIADPAAIAAAHDALSDAELLIADGHHRYETARVYADEVGGEGDHRYVLTCLVALQDPGLTVFPTHRLLTDLKDAAKQEAIRDALLRDFTVERIERDALEPDPATDGHVRLGYMDAHFRQPFRLTLKDPAATDAALNGFSPAYRRLDTAVLEALILRGALGMTDEDIDHKHGLDYSRSFAEALGALDSGRADAVFFTGATPVAHVGEVAAAGEVMPPKSTYFFPKVLTGLLFNPLD